MAEITNCPEEVQWRDRVIGWFDPNTAAGFARVSGLFAYTIIMHIFMVILVMNFSLTVSNKSLQEQRVVELKEQYGSRINMLENLLHQSHQQSEFHRQDAVTLRSMSVVGVISSLILVVFGIFSCFRQTPRPMPV